MLLRHHGASQRGQARLREQFDIVCSNDLQHWADGFLKALVESAEKAREHAADDVNGASIMPQSSETSAG